MLIYNFEHAVFLGVSMSTFRVRLTQGDARTGGGNMDRIALMHGAITDASNASPIVIEAASHGLVTGTRVTISGVEGNEAANGDFVITVVDADNFSLNGSNGDGGYSDGGVWRVDSNQRTIYCMGPNKINRKLKDGQVFTDCNYWKRFAYPTLPYNEAFIEVVVDDGSVYVDGVSGNLVRSYSITVDADSDFDDVGNTVDIIGDHGGYAAWCTITPSATVGVRINGSEDSDFNITGGYTHTFNQGDALIGTLQFERTTSGDSDIEIQVGVAFRCNS